MPRTQASTLCKGTATGAQGAEADLHNSSQAYFTAIAQGNTFVLTWVTRW